MSFQLNCIFDWNAVRKNEYNSIPVTLILVDKCMIVVALESQANLSGLGNCAFPGGNKHSAWILVPSNSSNKTARNKQFRVYSNVANESISSPKKYTNVWSLADNLTINIDKFIYKCNSNNLSICECVISVHQPFMPTSFWAANSLAISFVKPLINEIDSVVIWKSLYHVDPNENWTRYGCLHSMASHTFILYMAGNE